MKIIIYSANVGDYDYFYHPKFIDYKVSYYLFTDNKYFKSKHWNVLPIENLNHLDDRKKARFIKINSHKVLPNHDISIWVDHCFQVKVDNVENMLSSINFYDKNIMCYAHDERNCLYDEAKICIDRKLDSTSVIDQQISKYKKEMFPKNFGLFSTGFMIRKNNEKVNNFNNIWWQEIQNGVGRDQLSQSYASWKSGLQIDPIKVGKNVYNNQFLTPKNSHIKKYIKYI